MSTTNNSINNQIGNAANNTLLAHIRAASGQWDSYNDQTDSFGFYNFAGSPNTNVAADIGSICTDTTNGDLYVKSTDTVNTGWLLIASNGNFFVTGQRVTATGAFTYTPTTGMRFVVVELQGAGGGSGGCAAAGGQVALSGGAGGGGYAKFILTSTQVGASLNGTVGAGGAGGTAGANNGANGGDTTLATGAAWTAGGGALSNGGGAGSGGIQGGGAGGTVNPGTGTVLVSIAGETGNTGAGLAAGTSVIFSGKGGSPFLGIGGIANVLVPVNINLPGLAGTGFGAGGGGAISYGTGVADAGATGTNGIAIFTEYVIA